MRFASSAYDPDTITLMGQAYDAAESEAIGSGIAVGECEIMQSLMAKRILSVVGDGERDLVRLKLWALNALDADRFGAPPVVAA